MSLLSELALVTLAVISPAVAQGQSAASPKDMSALYDDATLQRWSRLLRPRIERLFRTRVAPVLPRRTRIRILSPETTPHGELLDFSSDFEARSITVPILGAKFTYDALFANWWLARHGRGMADLVSYINTLKHSTEADFPGGRYPTPFEALGIPVSEAGEPRFETPKDKADFDGIFNGAMLFNLAHEAGHVIKAHGQDALRNEIDADAFAAGVIADRAPEAAVGMAQFFIISAFWLPNQGDFDTPDQLAESIRLSAHPMNGSRIEALGQALEKANAAKQSEAVAQSASWLRSLGEYLNGLTRLKPASKFSLAGQPASTASSDLLELSKAWWGSSIETFPGLAGLRREDVALDPRPNDSGNRVLRLRDQKPRWAPALLRPDAFEFSKERGLVKITGPLPKEINDSVLRRALTRIYGPLTNDSLPGTLSTWTNGENLLGVTPWSFEIIPTSEIGRQK